MNNLDLKIKIIEMFLEDESSAYCYGYFEKKTGESRERIKKIMDGLRHNGTIEHVRGLIDDDGQVAGSGFALTAEATQQSVREWLSALKRIRKNDQ